MDEPRQPRPPVASPRSQPSQRARIFAKADIHVLLLEGVHQTAHEHLAAESFHVEVASGSLAPTELESAVAGVQLLGIRSKTRVPSSVLTAAPELLALGCFCIGTDQVDLDAARDHGVPVFNAPFSNTRSVAEMVIGEIIMLSRRLGERNQEMHAGRWQKTAAGSHEVRGKVLGIVGYGHIGSQVGVLAEALGMRVVYYDIVSKLPMGNNRPCATLGELLAVSDFVTLHVPETRETAHMVSAAELAAMKPQGYLLNTSRGSVLDYAALRSALARDHLAGAALDVFPEEPARNGSFGAELSELPNVILSPHVAGSTVEAQAAIGREVATALAAFVNRGTTLGAVNFPQVDLPPAKGTHRILNVHHNVPGVLRDINRIVSDRGANIHSQVLSTHATIGYLVMDLEKDVSREVGEMIASLGTSIRTRILY